MDVPAGPAFDASAERYDAREAANPIMQLLRERNRAAIDAAFRTPSRLLDVGAGTGTDAVALSQAGHRVVATDASEAMLAQLRDKVTAAALDVPSHVVAARDLEQLVGTYGKGAFDGAYSSFGPLNTEPDLVPVANALSLLVKPGGAFVASVLNRFAVVESAGMLAALKPKAAVRRLKSPLSVNVEKDGPAVDVYYWTVPDVATAFAPTWRVEHVAALPWLVPPPYAWKVLRRVPRALNALARADAALADQWPFTHLGDHFLITLRRHERGS